MRLLLQTIKAILALICCALLLAVALPMAGAAPSAGAIPTATSFIFPVGNGSIQPTWDTASANGYFITQGFNTSCDPGAGQGFYLYGLYYCGHTGVDLATQTASSVIHATAAGLVVSAGYNGGYGVMVRIQHLLPDGNYVYSQYEHMAYGSLAVYVGEVVSQGEQIGLVGATGFATGAHLHFEIKSVNEDGWGYTFGNSSLIAGYFEPVSFVAAHQYRPVRVTIAPGHAQPVFPAESDFILRAFLKQYQHYVVVSTSDGLRVRASAGLSGKVLGVALRGAKLGYVATKGAWLHVALPQKVTGWVNRKYVTGYQDWSTPAPKLTLSPAKVLVSVSNKRIWPPAGPVAIVDSSVTVGLNVHSAPGQNHPVVSSVFEGDKLAVLDRTTNWEHVLTRDGTKGWVLRRFLDETGSRASMAVHSISAVAPVLNVRNGPGLQYQVTGAVYRGTKMSLVRTTPHWAAVILPGGTTGWVAIPMTSGVPEKTVHAAPAAAKKAASALHVTYIVVTASVLNIRSAPGTSHRVVAQVLKKTRLQVLETTAHWAHVALPASTVSGWVLLSYTR